MIRNEEITIRIVPNKVPNKLLDAFPEINTVTWDLYLELMKNNKLTNRELAILFGMSDRMVRKYISVLREKGLITRVGSNKTGYWKVTKG